MNPFSDTPLQPNRRFMWSHPAHGVALAWGCGLSPWAPGTVGTLWAWVSYLFLAIYLDELAIGVFLVCALLVGLWSCAVTARNLNTADPSCIVWDEVLAFWLVLWLITPTGWIEQLLAFGLFRFFDIVKPGPVAWADRLFHAYGSVQIHGYKASAGILLDDLVAAFCTLLVIALGRTMLGLMGILP